MAEIRGTEGDDRIEPPRTNPDSIDTIYGLGGDDTIYGNNNAEETLYGGDGDDALYSPRVGYGEAGNDYMFGGVFAGGFCDRGIGNDTLNGLLFDDTLLGGGGDDYVDGGPNSDSIDGGAGNDTLHGGGGNLTIRTQSNTISGGEGDDFVSGGLGADLLDGGIGKDIIVGGTEADTLSGGIDFDFDRLVTQADGVEDVLVLNSPGAQEIGVYDQIEGFESGIDKIDVRSTGALALVDLAFSDYAGVGIKVIGPDGSAVLVLGQQFADATSDWFIFG